MTRQGSYSSGVPRSSQAAPKRRCHVPASAGHPNCTTALRHRTLLAYQLPQLAHRFPRRLILVIPSKRFREKLLNMGFRHDADCNCCEHAITRFDRLVECNRDLSSTMLREQEGLL